MDNSLKVIFKGNDKDTVYLPIKEGAETNNSLFGLIEERDQIEKITYPADLPKDIKSKVFPILDSTVTNLFNLKLIESEVDIWVRGGFGESIDKTSDAFMKTKGLDSTNLKHIDFIAEYDKIHDMITDLNFKMKSEVKKCGKVGLHWHSLPEFKVSRK